MGLGITPFSDGICLLCRIVSSVSPTLSPPVASVADIWWSIQYSARLVVVLWTYGLAIISTATHTALNAFWFIAPFLVSAFGGITTVLALISGTGNYCPVAPDLTRYG